MNGNSDAGLPAGVSGRRPQQYGTMNGHSESGLPAGVDGGRFMHAAQRSQPTPSLSTPQRVLNHNPGSIWEPDTASFGTTLKATVRMI